VARGAVALLVAWNCCQVVAYEAGIQRPDSHPDWSWTLHKRRRWRRQLRKEADIIRRIREPRFPAFLPVAADAPTTATGGRS
jgi:hypothetical protein